MTFSGVSIVAKKRLSIPMVPNCRPSSLPSISEAFFEIPEMLDSEYPEVYAQLRSFYCQDPLQKPDGLRGEA